MAYQKQEWIDRVIDPAQIDSATGKPKVVQEGTRFTSTRANHFEQGIEDAHNLVESLAKEWVGNFVAAPGGTAGLQFSASGLTANWTAGVAYVNGRRFEVAAGNITLNPTQGQYIYLDVDGVVKNTTTQATTNAALPLWYFATDASQVITATDQRNTLNPDALTADQTLTLPTSAPTGKLRQWLSWITNMITKVTGKPNWWQTPATTLEAANTHMIDSTVHVTPAERTAWNGKQNALGSNSVTDTMIWNRTVDQATATAYANTGSLTQILSWFAKVMKGITGKTNWYDTPATTLEAANTHMNTTTGVHGATSAPTANALMQRDASGRAQVADPAAAQDIATKAYVDVVAQGFDQKGSVRVATTGNITLSGTQTIDGIALAVNDRVLVKDQTTASQNGIYTVQSGAWARAIDADTSAEVTPGMYTFVEDGTANGGNGFTLLTKAPITLGTTALTFSQTTGAGQIIAGTGLKKSGNTLSTDSTTAGGTEANKIAMTDSSGKVGAAKAADTAGGYSPNTGTVSSTIPVRDASGKLPGSITGDAATVGGKSLADIVNISQTFVNFTIAYNAAADSLDFTDTTTGNIVKRLYRDGTLKIVGQLQEVTVMKIGQDIVCTEDMTTGTLTNVTGTGTSLSLTLYASSGNRVQTYDLTSVKVVGPTTKLSWTLSPTQTTTNNVSSVIASGNYFAGGSMYNTRKLTKLSNGWLIACSTEIVSSSNYPRFWVSKDGGSTWSLLCTVNTPVMGIAVTCVGTVVHYVAQAVGNASLLYGKFDATTVTPGSQLSTPATIVTVSANGMYGCSIVSDSIGNLYIALCAITATYASSSNLMQITSTDGGSTWSSLATSYLTTYNNAAINVRYPVIVMKSDGYPFIACTSVNGSYYILGYAKTAGGWQASNLSVVATYSQNQPSAFVDSAGFVHVSWDGADATDTAVTNVRYIKSTNTAGTTWGTAQKLTTGNSYGQGISSVSADSQNNPVIYFAGVDPAVNTSYSLIRKVVSTDGGATWSAPINVTTYVPGNGTGSYPNLIDNVTNYIEPLVMYIEGGNMKFKKKDQSTVTIPTNSAVVETSIDGGATWQTVTNGGVVPNMVSNTDVKGKSLKVRQTLSAVDAGNGTTVSPTLSNVKLEVYSKVG